MITSLVVSFSGTVSYTNETTGGFHGESLPDGSSYSSIGSDGYKDADNVRWSNPDDVPPYPWNTTVENFFVNLSWAISNALLDPTAQEAEDRKTVSDLVMRLVIRCTTDETTPTQPMNSHREIQTQDSETARTLR